MRGRRPILPELHKLQGTYEATRHAGRTGVVAEGELRTAPPGLSPAQRRLWQYAIRHAPPGVLRLIDRDMLMLWIVTKDRYDQAQQQLARLESDPPAWAKSPLHRIIDRAAALLLRLASELGFTPVARRGLQLAPLPPTPDPNDPWAMLKLIPGGKGDPEPA